MAAETTEKRTVSVAIRKREGSAQKVLGPTAPASASRRPYKEAPLSAAVAAMKVCCATGSKSLWFAPCCCTSRRSHLTRIPDVSPERRKHLPLCRVVTTVRWNGTLHSFIACTCNRPAIWKQADPVSLAHEEWRQLWNSVWVCLRYERFAVM